MSTVKLGTAEGNFFRKYDRKFIQLDRNICMLIHLFEKDDDHSWEDVWLQDFTGVYERDMLLYEEAAKQFIKQLEGHYCIAFLEALRNECDKHVQEHRERCRKIEKNENSSSE